MLLDMNEKYILSGAFELIDFDGEAILLPIESKSIADSCLYGVEGIGGDVLSCIEKQFTLIEIIEYIAKLYNESRSTVEEDICAFIKDLHSSGIVKILEV